ncbi:MAG: alpha-ribazole phosphatase [Marinifilaceae bacterium]|jgi:alpha-ribazole phosphatase|nr:alpha-ribazole phosphatase [Marinifilaceae bacterium]
MRIYLVRHTVPLIDKGICYGQSDIAISEADFCVWREIRYRIRNVKMDKIYSSPLYRCRRLAYVLSKGEKIEYSNLLKEIDFGDWELKSWDEIYNDKRSSKWFSDYVNCKTPKGESNADLINRVEVFISKIKSQAYDNCLVVCHAGVIRAFYSILTNISVEDSFEIKINYGEIIEFNI